MKYAQFYYNFMIKNKWFNNSIYIDTAINYINMNEYDILKLIDNSSNIKNMLNIIHPNFKSITTDKYQNDIYNYLLKIL